MENETCVHIETAYKKKKVKVKLRFSKEESDNNAKYFQDQLKKIYMKKSESEAFIPNVSALKCNG